MKQLELNTAKIDKKKLKNYIKNEKNARMLRRLIAIQMTAAGIEQHTICSVLHISRKTLYRWIKFCNENSGDISHYSASAVVSYNGV